MGGQGKVVEGCRISFICQKKVWYASAQISFTLSWASQNYTGFRANSHPPPNP
jgi:hypothetical protein